MSSAVLDEVGFNSHSQIQHHNKCCNYIMKYITKDCIRNDHGQIYISSRGLKKAQKSNMNVFDFTDFPNFFENDFCCKTSFSLEDLTMEQKIKILNNFS